MKTKFKKTLALLLAALMLIGVMPAMSLTAFADGGNDYPVITADSEAEVTLDYGERAYFKFVPEKTDFYAFYSTAENVDPYGYVYLVDPAEEGAVAYLTNDDSGSVNNFRIESVLEAETVYYLGAGFCGDSNSGTYTVKLETLHQNDGYNEEEITIQPTCSAMGSATVECRYCHEPYSIAIPKLSHTDENTDGICDVCEEQFAFYLTDGVPRTGSVNYGDSEEVRFKCETSGYYYLFRYANYMNYSSIYYDFDENNYVGWEDYFYLEAGKTYCQKFINNYSAEQTGTYLVSVCHEHNDSGENGVCSICGKKRFYEVTDGEAKTLTINPGDIVTAVIKPQETGNYTVQGYSYGNVYSRGFKCSDGSWPSSNSNNEYTLEGGKTYLYKFYNLGEEPGEAKVTYTHAHFDGNGDGLCDNCNKQFKYTLTEGEPLTFTADPGDNIQFTFECAKDAVYNFNYNGGGYLMNVRCGDDYVWNSGGGYSLEAGKTYTFYYSGGSSGGQTTVTLRHIHNDGDNDGKCDLCNKQYYFVAEEDVPLEFVIPANEEYAVKFTAPRKGAFVFDCSNNVYGSLYREYDNGGNEWVNSYYNNYNGYKACYNLENGVTYTYRFYTDSIERNAKVTVRHAHKGTETIIVEPGIASQGAGSIICDICHEKFCGLIDCTGSEVEKVERDGLIYRIYEKDGEREAALVDCDFVEAINNLPENLVIPDNINGVTLTAIDQAPYYGKGVKSVTIPDTVVSIGDDAFVAYTSLESVTIPDSVKIIGEMAFFACTNLKEINLGRGVKYIGKDAFRILLNDEEKQEIATEAAEMEQAIPEAQAEYFAEWSEHFGVEITSWDQLIELAEADETLSEEDVEDLKETKAEFEIYSYIFDIYDEVAALEESPIETINYAGSSADWEDIFIDSSNDEAIDNAEIIFDIFIARLIVDNEVWDTIEFSATQESLNLPEVPKKTGYTGRWSDYILEAKDIEITAIYEPITYHATIKADGEIIDVIDFVYGDETLNLPDVPGKEGYTGSWPDYTLGAEDITIEAVYKINSYTVSYVVDGNTQTTAEIEFGESIIIPRSPEKKGYTFGGWVDADGKSPEDYDGMPAKNLTFEAVWTINQYTITFDTAGGSEIEAIKQNYDTDITAPADPTREGYTFQGWKPEIPAKMPADDMTVVAQWKINQYTITFDTDGGNEIEAITQDYDTDITAPADPVKTGYTFTGWQPEIPAKMPAENITVKAVYEQITYHATIKADGETITVIDFVYGQKSIALPDVPEKEGYTGSWPTYTLGAEDLTIEAVYKINYYYAFYKDG
ncbi:MAG: InlB B-repeat-containing protein, partial [Clostridia bacterium]|nr:InlB B-repeat-containing protein [Clostridia bacterium]